jgi:N-acetylglucosaminyl-diphospho-decaprenol L-rhamnosyltransferase
MQSIPVSDSHLHCITVSVVSHGHGSMVEDLVHSLLGFSEVIKIILTLNVPEPALFSVMQNFPNVRIIENQHPLGFGENHNVASQYCDTDFFCVLNPDIQFSNNPFKSLLSEIAGDVMLVAPIIINGDGEIEDSARYFPTPLNMFGRIIGFSRGRYPLGSMSHRCEPDWLAGMFLLLRKVDFVSVGGFDERFFLYLEDADLSLRIRRSGRSVVLCKKVCVIHNAQRTSHKNMKYLAFHLMSLIRFFIHHLFRFPKR